MKTSAILGGLSMLCQLNKSRGAVYAETRSGPALVASSSADVRGVDQQFLDQAREIWNGSGSPPRSGIRMFPIEDGAIFLDNIDEEACSARIREHVIMAISEALADAGEPSDREGRELEAVRRFWRSKLEQVGWNVCELARREGCTSKTIHNRMKRFGIRRPARQSYPG